MTGRADIVRRPSSLAQRLRIRQLQVVVAIALGLDRGPMSGFLHDVLDREFFAGTPVKSNFLINIGYGDPARLRPRAGRFAFDEVCRIV